MEKEIELLSEKSYNSSLENQNTVEPFVIIQNNINESTLNSSNDDNKIQPLISSSVVPTQDTKFETPNATPDDDNESTITRVSECSDDSNLIKLDLSQLVGETSNNSDDTIETKDICNENEENIQRISGK